MNRNMVRSWMAVAACLGLMLAEARGQGLDNFKPTFSGTGAAAKLTSFTVDVYTQPVLPALFDSKLAKGIKLDVDYYDSTGTHVGTTTTVKVDATTDGKVTVIVDPAYSGLGYSLKFTVTDPLDCPSCSQSKPIKWFLDKGKSTPTGKIDPAGLPGGSPQHWFFQQSPIYSLIDDPSGARDLTVLSSGFDLSYVPTALDHFDVIAMGNDNFMRMSDGTVLVIPDGALFGDIEVAPGALTGAFDFAAIGLGGEWSFDPVGNYTSAFPSFSNLFELPAYSVETRQARVPEPGSLALLLAALAAIRVARPRQGLKESRASTSRRPNLQRRQP